MKPFFLLLTVFAFSMNVFAQGHSHQKVKNNSKSNSKAGKSDNNGNGDGAAVYNNGSNGKNAGHQPKKVQAALYRDYPVASNVVWSKYKGDYTATFTNGPWRSTAVYHANGDRRDTRTVVTRKDLPGTIWDIIFKRDRVVPTGYVVIERPTLTEKIFRIMTSNNTAVYYDDLGNKVQYNF